jgi:DNA-binding response OmpR family regulator
MSVRILVIEDDPPWRALLRELLTIMGYEVLDAAEGFFGAQRAVIERPDLIVLDLGLPHIHGFRVLEELKRRAELAEIPVVVVSGYDDVATRRTVRELGAAAFLSKLVTPDEILATVRDCLGEDVAQWRAGT